MDRISRKEITFKNKLDFVQFSFFTATELKRTEKFSMHMFVELYSSPVKF